MRLLRILYKLPVFITFALAYVVTSLFWRAWTQDLSKRRSYYCQTVSFYCSLALWILNFKVQVLGKSDRQQSYLIVGNHLGFLDILVLASVHPSLFVTSLEMKQTPGLGLMTEMAGCLYVDRKKRTGIADEVNQLRQALHQGFTVTLYPEGTSSNGEQMLPLKASLLAAAVGTGIPILPAVINYRKVNGEPMSDRWRDFVFWYGELTFAPALFRIMSLKSVEVELQFCETLDTSTDQHRREIANQLQAVLESKFTKIPKVNV
jgi:1-acyl-sn-glycerol-3-phosphate acyltransferase